MLGNILTVGDKLASQVQVELQGLRRVDGLAKTEGAVHFTAREALVDDVPEFWLQ